MKDFLAPYYFTCGYQIEFVNGLRFDDPAILDSRLFDSPADYKYFLDFVTEIRQNCDRDNFISAVHKCDFLLNELRNGTISYRQAIFTTNEIKRSIEFDMTQYFFYRMTRGERQDLENVTFFGVNSFRDMQIEAEESVKCYVFERYTASVCHLMRLLELLHQKLGEHFGVTPKKNNEYIPITDADWGRLSSLVEQHINSILSDNANKRTENEKKELLTLQSLLYPLRIIREVRNKCMHGLETYGKEQAEEIAQTCSPQIRAIAKFLSGSSKIYNLNAQSVAQASP